jgi:hypothetical protein
MNLLRDTRTQERTTIIMMIAGSILLILEILHVNLFFDRDIIRSAAFGLLCGGGVSLYLRRQQAWERKFNEEQSK